MRQILKIKIALVLGVLGGIFVSVVTSPTTAVTHAETDLMAIHGLGYQTMVFKSGYQMT
jgi:hypothetical protein